MCLRRRMGSSLRNSNCLCASDVQGLQSGTLTALSLTFTSAKTVCVCVARATQVFTSKTKAHEAHYLLDIPKTYMCIKIAQFLI